jgi:hypothetical protein
MSLPFLFIFAPTQCVIMRRVGLKVPKYEILISWILMIFFHEVSIGRGL